LTAPTLQSTRSDTPDAIAPDGAEVQAAEIAPGDALLIPTSYRF
jgi:hypothetical protein